MCPRPLSCNYTLERLDLRAVKGLAKSVTLGMKSESVGSASVFHESERSWWAALSKEILSLSCHS